MDCAQMRQWVLDGGDVGAPEAMRHTDACPACRTLFADKGELRHLLDDLAAARVPVVLPDFATRQARLPV
jgi:predicted anti-sigma-YlaC factor YlaD